MKSTRYLAHIFVEELAALRQLVLEQKGLAIGLVVLLLAAGYYLRPFHSHRVVIATADPGSGYEQMAMQLQRDLGRQGVEVVLRHTSGSVENLELLRDPASGVDAAFVQGGVLAPGSAGALQSLGSTAFEPVWVFYRKELKSPPARLRDLAQLRVGVGPEKGGTQALFEKLLRLEGVEMRRESAFRRDSYERDMEDFRAGRLDALVQVTPVFDADVQTLLRDPDARLLEFPLATAYEKNLPFVQRADFPAGVVDVRAHIPARDTRLITTTTSLLVSPSLHPNLQTLMLMALREESRNAPAPMFGSERGFPAYLDRSVPLSPAATEFYEVGAPAVMRHLPFWAAGFLNRMWLLLLGTATVVYTLSKLNVRARAFRNHLHHHAFYDEFLRLDRMLVRGPMGEGERDAFRRALERLERTLAEERVPVGLEHDHVDLVRAVELLRAKAERRGVALLRATPGAE